VVVARCAPERCEGREGAAFVEERIYHKRKPWLKKRVGTDGTRVVTIDGRVGAITDALRSIRENEVFETAEKKSRPGFRLYAAGAMVAFSVFLLAFALDWAWKALPHSLDDPSRARLIVSVDMNAGERIIIKVDGKTLFEKPYDEEAGGVISFYERINLDPGSGGVTVALRKRGEAQTLEASTASAIKAGEVLVARENMKTGAMEIIRGGGES